MTGKIASAESLIRWFHPKKGFISPGVFIPALEKSGHISELDLYVLDSVNEFQKKRYQSDKITVPVSTNLSWMDFYDETIMNWLEKKCADAPCRPVCAEWRLQKLPMLPLRQIEMQLWRH